MSFDPSLTRTRLGESEVAAIIARLAENKNLPAGVLPEIVKRTDGIPLFVEEMTKAVLEAESEGEARRTFAAIPSPALAVPASLHASLMARLDRLGPAKEVAQIGAAIGREFSHALLAAVVRKPEAELGSALDRLTAAGLLFRQGIPPHAVYLFKHALVRDATYGTLLRGRRQELHGRVVSVLQRDFPELIVNQPEVLAHHCSEGGMIPEAIEYCLSASKRATAAFNTIEASVHLRRGMTLVEQLPSSEPRKAQLQDRLLTGGWWF
jgi:predicted ATPase